MERRVEEVVPLRAGIRRFDPRTAQMLDDAKDIDQQSPLLMGRVVTEEDLKLQVVRNGKAERTEIVQNTFKTTGKRRTRDPEHAW